MLGSVRSLTTAMKKNNINCIITRINGQITSPELRVVDENGKNLGVLKREEALALVKPGLDLIEIAPGAKPPVARIMSFDKYRYEKSKQEKKERQAQKGTNLKQVQITARAAAHDLMVKVRQLEKFLEEGHPVEINLFLKGREKYNKEWARQKLDQFLTMIPAEYKRLTEPRFGGRGMTMQIVKK